MQQTSTSGGFHRFGSKLYQSRRCGMRRFCFLLVVLLGFPLPLRAADDPDKKVGDLYVVGIGQEDGWNFLPEGFEKIFRDQGKAFYRDMHSRVLLGDKATRKELLAGVE